MDFSELYNLTTNQVNFIEVLETLNEKPEDQDQEQDQDSNSVQDISITSHFISPDGSPLNLEETTFSNLSISSSLQTPSNLIEKLKVEPLLSLTYKTTITIRTLSTFSQVYQLHLDFIPSCTNILSSWIVIVDQSSTVCEVYDLCSGLKVVRIQDELLNIKWVDMDVWYRHLLVFSGAKLRLNIFDVQTWQLKSLLNPKFATKDGYSYRFDNKYIAFLELSNQKDGLGIYHLGTFTLKKFFKLDTFDAKKVSWSPEGQFLAVSESYLEYSIYIYTPTGSLVTKFMPYSVGLGIYDFFWLETTHQLAITSYDDQVRIVNNLLWQVDFTFSKPKVLVDKEVILFKELENQSWQLPVIPKDQLQTKRNLAKYVLEKAPYPMPNQTYYKSQVHSQTQLPKLQLKVQPNSDFSLIYIIYGSAPTCLFIYDLKTYQLLTCLHQLEPIQHILWNPVDTCQLVLTTTQGNLIYLWNKHSGPECFQIPDLNFKVQSLLWSSDGLALALTDKTKLCIGFPPTPTT